jgi:hypothetical protein
MVNVSNDAEISNVLHTDAKIAFILLMWN